MRATVQFTKPLYPRHPGEMSGVKPDLQVAPESSVFATTRRYGLQIIEVARILPESVISLKSYKQTCCDDILHDFTSWHDHSYSLGVLETNSSTQLPIISMKRLISLLSLLAGLAVTAHATSIQIAYTVAIPTQPTPGNGLQDIQDWAVASVATYNLTHTDLPDVPSFLPTVVNPGGSIFGANVNGQTSVTLDLTGYSGYIVMSWGGSSFNKTIGNGTLEFLYYITGETTEQFTNQDPLATGGLSSIHYWNTPPSRVPDGGTTAVLLGLGLVAVSFVARRRSA